MATVPASQPSVTPPGESLQQRFQRLADTWHKAVAHHSSSRVRNNHPAYQEIIGLGNSVVPLLLRDLEQTGRHWFWAFRGPATAWLNEGDLLPLDEDHAFLESFLQLMAQCPEVVIRFLYRSSVDLERHVLVLLECPGHV